jgi:isocitrate dehydrogenase kinase/phosphatase
MIPAEKAKWVDVLKLRRAFEGYYLSEDTFNSVWVPLMEEENITAPQAFVYIKQRLKHTDVPPGLPEIIKECKPKKDGDDNFF